VNKNAVVLLDHRFSVQVEILICYHITRKIHYIDKICKYFVTIAAKLLWVLNWILLSYLVDMHDPEVVRRDFTLKFNGIPKTEPMPDKKVKVEIVDEQGTKFTAILIAKSFRKAEETAAGLDNWVAAICGELSKNEDGWDILNAGIQIFEKKAKQPKESIANIE
jgi:hypothetical protein